MTPYRLICFDLDGTLIDDTVYIWHTLHDAFEVPPELRLQHYESFMKGELTYAQWFDLDILEWKKRNKTKSDLIRVIQGLKPMKGARETLLELKKRNYELAIVSGSLSLVVETLLSDIPFDEILINRLVFDSDGTIQKGIPTPYDIEHKASGLLALAGKRGISAKECVFIGDNENDLSIAGVAGLSIAFNSKSASLSRICHKEILEKDLSLILNFF